MENGAIRTCRGFYFRSHHNYCEVYAYGEKCHYPLDLMLARGKGFPRAPIACCPDFLEDIRKCHVDWLSRITTSLRENPRFMINIPESKDYGWIHRNDNVSAKFFEGGNVEFHANFFDKGFDYDGEFVPEQTRKQFLSQIAGIPDTIRQYFESRNESKRIKAKLAEFIVENGQYPALDCHVY